MQLRLDRLLGRSLEPILERGPIRQIVPAPSTSIFRTSGLTSGGGGLPVGMLRLTECNWIGIVMISITSSTSITSINGVVLMSIMTSGSLPLPEPTFMAMNHSPRSNQPARLQLPRTGGSVMKPTLAIPARWHA
jgi:hypothetical protein